MSFAQYGPYKKRPILPNQVSLPAIETNITMCLSPNGSRHVPDMHQSRSVLVEEVRK
jgi:hypothetical protein